MPKTSSQARSNFIAHNELHHNVDSNVDNSDADIAFGNTLSGSDDENQTWGFAMVKEPMAPHNRKSEMPMVGSLQ